MDLMRKPTNEQIDSEPAGMQLNAWVAEHLMGWRRVEHTEKNWGERPYIAVFPDGTTNVYAVGNNCWSPSYDDGVALTLLPFLLAKFKAIWIECELSPGGQLAFGIYLDGGWNNPEPLIDHAPTLPLAICRAALKSIAIDPRGDDRLARDVMGANDIHPGYLDASDAPDPYDGVSPADQPDVCRLPRGGGA